LISKTIFETETSRIQSRTADNYTETFVSLKLKVCIRIKEFVNHWDEVSWKCTACIEKHEKCNATFLKAVKKGTRSDAEATTFSP
jgi:hypothetical protein